MNNYEIRGDGPLTLVGWDAIVDGTRSRIVGHEVCIGQGNDVVIIDVDRVEELITALRFGAQLARELKVDDYRAAS